ncbi:MAG: hybrid sensor histidine kinase/response regulator [Sandaracinus sp.]
MAGLQAPRVLVVDDVETNRLLVVETLASESMEVVECANGADAIARFEQAPFDLVLLDVRMPGLDGFATLERLRALPGGDVPVVFVTALRDVDTFDRARAAGAVDFLTKPVRPTELLARVETLLRLHRLGAEVREQLVEIRRQRDDLLRVQLQKERLTTFVVHDLKNPLGVMRLHADILARAKDVGDGARESAVAIREQCDRLQQLVLNLLDLSRSDEGRLVALPSQADVGALITSVAQSARVYAESRRAVLTADAAAGLSWWIDADLLRRVLENLVDNAIRHVPARGEVHLEAREESGRLELRVRDSGTGIPEAMRERIFDPFVQIESTAGASRSGRGLGLAFCRAAVEAHGGTIAVDGAVPGACFVLRIPRAEARP